MRNSHFFVLLGVIVLGIITNFGFIYYHHTEYDPHPEKILFKRLQDHSLTRAIVNNRLLKWTSLALPLALDEVYNKKWTLRYFGGVVERGGDIREAFYDPIVYHDSNAVTPEKVDGLTPFFGKFHLEQGINYRQTFIIPRKNWRKDDGTIHVIYSDTCYYLIPDEFVMGK